MHKVEISSNHWAGVGLICRGAGIALVGDPPKVAARMKEHTALGGGGGGFSAMASRARTPEQPACDRF